MAGPKEVLRLHVVGDGDFDRLGTIARADARRHAKAWVGVDGNGERRAKGRGVKVGLAVEAELVALFAGQGETDRPAPVVHDEVHLLRRHRLGRVDEVTLILAILVVHQDDGLAGFKLFQDVGQGRKRHVTF